MNKCGGIRNVATLGKGCATLVDFDLCQWLYIVNSGVLAESQLNWYVSPVFWPLMGDEQGHINNYQTILSIELELNGSNRNRIGMLWGSNLQMERAVISTAGYI